MRKVKLALQTGGEAYIARLESQFNESALSPRKRTRYGIAPRSEVRRSYKFDSLVRNKSFGHN